MLLWFTPSSTRPCSWFSTGEFARWVDSTTRYQLGTLESYNWFLTDKNRGYLLILSKRRNKSCVCGIFIATLINTTHTFPQLKDLMFLAMWICCSGMVEGPKMMEYFIGGWIAVSGRFLNRAHLLPGNLPSHFSTTKTWGHFQTIFGM